MRSASFLLPMAMLALSACGPNNDVGFQASGQVEATVNPAGGTAWRAGFNLTNPNGGPVQVDPSLPAGATMGFVGQCNVGPNGRTIQITRVGGDLVGMHSLSVNLNAWAQDTCTNCQHGTISVAIQGANDSGETTYSATDMRSATGTSGSCTLNATRSSSYGMQITAQCTGLAASGSTNTVDVNGTFTLEGCDGPESRNP